MLLNSVIRQGRLSPPTSGLARLQTSAVGRRSPQQTIPRFSSTTNTTTTTSSSEQQKVATVQAVPSARAPALQSTTTPPPSVIERHGPLDGVVCLNVGGKEFRTLRSTISTNAVLARYVASAEANQELTSSGNAVFIDRDPKLFGIILTFLRNKVEGISYNSKYGKLNPKATAQYVRLDTKSGGSDELLRDLWVEATYFQIPELLYQICHKSWYIGIMSRISPGGNPFQAATRFMNALRGSAVALAGGGSILTILTYDFEQISGVKVPDSIKKNVLHIDEKELKALEGGSGGAVLHSTTKE